MSRYALFLPLLLILPAAALADAQSDCQAAAGHYLTGEIVSAPKFAHGKPLHGVELSHTHFSLRADQDQQTYDVAADNVFAPGYDQSKHAVPAPLNALHAGQHVELCGQLYTGGGVGIHWVHTNCGASPTPNAPDGWVRVLDSDGARGDNLEGSTEYCRLWGNKG